MKLLKNESAANELWRLCDSGEIEDLLTHLRQHPPSAELVAMVMLTGKSKLQHQTQTSKGGTVKASAYMSLKTQAQEAWRQDKSKRSKSAFADRWLSKKIVDNRKLESEGKTPEKLPEAGTVRKWLAGIEKETN